VNVAQQYIWWSCQAYTLPHSETSRPYYGCVPYGQKTFPTLKHPDPTAGVFHMARSHICDPRDFHPATCRLHQTVGNPRDSISKCIQPDSNPRPCVTTSNNYDSYHQSFIHQLVFKSKRSPSSRVRLSEVKFVRSSLSYC